MTLHSCEKCMYSTKNRWVYDDHLKSKKHIAMQSDETAVIFQHTCKVCNKKYKSDRGLRKHNVTCKPDPEETSILLAQILKMKEEMKELKSQMALHLISDNAMIAPNTVANTNNSNSHNNIVDIANSAITNNSHNVTYRDINNNTSIHQNVHVYLNTHCHDTPSINEFIDNIQFSKAEIDQIVRAHQGEQIHKALIRVFKSKLQDVPFQQRPLHCVKPAISTSTCPGESSLFVMDDQEWKEENAGKTATQIRDVEVYDDDSDAEYQLPEEKTGEIKTPLNKATAKFTRKMHDVCEELYSDKDEQSKAEDVMIKIRKCSTIGDLVESLEHMSEISLDSSQIDQEA